MTCDSVERENIVERYLRGRLEPAVKEEWELHYFGCDRCAQQLETWRAIADPLREMAPEIRQEISRPRPSRRWIWAGAALAAALLLAVGAGILLQPRRVAAPVADSQPSLRQPLVELAQLDPPAYPPAVSRGLDSPAERQFTDAMQAYRRRDYSQAIVGLRAALQLDSQAAAPRFFLGACYLLSGRTAEGIEELKLVAAGNSPFAEESAFDLAKGYLLQGDRDHALAALRPLAAGHGDFALQANQLIARIPETH